MAILADPHSGGGSSLPDGREELSDRERAWLAELHELVSTGAGDRAILDLVDGYAAERFALLEPRLPVRPARPERAPAPSGLFARPGWTPAPEPERHLDLDTILELGRELEGASDPVPAAEVDVDADADADSVWVYDPPAWLDPDRVRVIDLNAIEAADDAPLTPLLPFGVGVPADEDWWVLNAAEPTSRRGR